MNIISLEATSTLHVINFYCQYGQHGGRSDLRDGNGTRFTNGVLTYQPEIFCGNLSPKNMETFLSKYLIEYKKHGDNAKFISMELYHKYTCK
jgi:hypothetical protein